MWFALPDDISVVTAACIGTGILTIVHWRHSLRPAEPQRTNDAHDIVCGMLILSSLSLAVCQDFTAEQRAALQGRL